MDTTRTLDLREAVAELRDERLPDLEDEQSELVDEAMQIDPPQSEDENERYAQIEQEFDELEAARATLEGYIEAIESVIEEWDGSEFIVRELTGGDVRRIKDEVSEKSGEEGYREGYHEILVLRRSIEKQPPGAPTRREKSQNVPAPEEYPNRVFSWLFDRVNALNTVGQFELGNSRGLRDEMRQRRQSEESTQTAEQATSGPRPSSTES